MCVFELTALNLQVLHSAKLNKSSQSAVHADARIKRRKQAFQEAHFVMGDQDIIHMLNKESIVLKHLELHSPSDVEAQRRE